MIFKNNQALRKENEALKTKTLTLEKDVTLLIEGAETELTLHKVLEREVSELKKQNEKLKKRLEKEKKRNQMYFGLALIFALALMVMMVYISV